MLSAIWIALALLFGRSLLALLPAGAPGAGGRSALIGAGVAAWLIGRVALDLAAAVEGAWTGQGGGAVALGLLLSAPLVLALRSALGPAAMRPGRPLVVPQPGPAAPGRAAGFGRGFDLLALALALAVLAHGAQRGEAPPLPVLCDGLALAGLGYFAARVLALPSRLWPAAALVPAALASLLVQTLGPAAPALALGPLAAATFGALFRVRPERRFLWVAALGLVPVSAWTHPRATALGPGLELALALLGALALVLWVPGPSRRRLLAPLALTGALAILRLLGATA